MVRLPALCRIPSRLGRRARRRRMATLLCMLAIILATTVPLYVIYKPPRALIRHLASRWPDVLWEVQLPGGGRSGQKKLVALTIDDAPSEHTEQILEALSAHGATATFFTIGGQVSGREDILAEVVRSGHELGNHAMHDEPSRALPDAELARQIELVRDRIRAAYAAAARPVPPQYFRPGSGFFSDRMRRLVDKLGYRLVLGGIYPHDPQIGSARMNAKHILSMVYPGGIIICHDRRSWTAPMLRRVLPELKRRGYKVVGLTELVEAAQGH